MKHFFPTAVLRRALPAAAVLLLAASAVPAHAAARDTLPGNWLQLTLTRATAQSSGTRGTLLLCHPPQGHSRALEACGQLEAAGGDPGGLAPVPGAVCTMVYAPVTARASGRWNGRSVEYSQTFNNDCELAALTGAVFALDEAEAGAGAEVDVPEV